MFSCGGCGKCDECLGIIWDLPPVDLAQIERLKGVFVQMGAGARISLESAVEEIFN